MENNYYKDSIKEAVEKLFSAREELFTSIFHIAMAGELNEWNKSVEVGEVHEFTKDVFEGCEDTNIKILTKLLTHIEKTAESICNINGIVCKP